MSKAEIMLIVFRETGICGVELDKCVSSISDYISEEIQSKEQHIIYLTQLLNAAESLIEDTSFFHTSPKESINKYNSLLDLYQLKYPKP